ncbi:MFS transporter [Actinomadura livida]|uniref:MFS family permease n=1 Tax=Actinomadura livida TaxID=79909 RepID=A0A7W7I7T0_9ACTN|nr:MULTISPECIES: MFS transporter [Actinomadura]MBB4772035.1 MFS family permease [Actinomadura catellatispora]
MLAALCITEITSWGVLYYAFPVLAPVITADTGWSTTGSTAAFSAALIVAALVGIPVGRVLDRRGPHALMTGGSVLAAIAIVAVAAAPSLLWFAAAWFLAGVAMSAVLYQPAFAALTRYYAPRHLPALTTLTLVAGLASTVFAPLTDALAGHLTWRGVYLALAAVLAAVTIPLHAIALRRPWPGSSGDRSAAADHAAGHAADHAAGRAARPPAVRHITRSRPFWLLAIALTLSAFAMFAVLINLIPLLTHRGASPTLAAWALGLGGIGQVAGRLCYRPLSRHTSVRGRTVWILGLSAATTAALALIPGPVRLLIAVVVLAGVTRGIATLLQATAVTDRWSIAAYGTLSGILAAPITVATALAPWAGAALADALGSYPALFAVLALTAALAALLASVPTHHNRTPGTKGTP